MKEVHKLLTKPSLVNENASLKEVVERITEDPKTRAVYVVDSKKKLKGIIVLKAVLKSAFLECIPEPYLSFSSLMSVKPKIKEAKDMMVPPIYVKEKNTIKDAFILMMQNDLEEIPVVDDDLRVIGDLNMLELLKLWMQKLGE